MSDRTVSYQGSATTTSTARIGRAVLSGEGGVSLLLDNETDMIRFSLACSVRDEQSHLFLASPVKRRRLIMGAFG